MKKFNIAVLSVAAALLVSSCATTQVTGSGIKNTGKTKVQKSTVTLLDYQGMTFGSEIPQWVVEVGNGNYSEAYLKQFMPGVEGKKLFVTIGRGDNLAYVTQWTDLVDVEVQVGDEMQRVVGKAVSASQKGRNSQIGDTSAATRLEQELNMYKEAVSAVELNGLEKIASYWVQKEITPVNDKKNKKVYYEYYAVWGMEKKLYDTQLAKALESVEDNTDEGRALKAALSQKLQNMMVTSNNEEVTNEAEDELLADL